MTKMLWLVRPAFRYFGTTAVSRGKVATATKPVIKPVEWRDTRYTTNPIDLSEPTFDKILIANRGEIAVRIIRTAKKMGIKTVAVYSTADSRSMHVEMADEKICIGEPAAAKSYLVMDNILDAIKKTGAQAVHPGYGFLSENASFVEKLESMNVKFIGPSAAAIQAMGDKIESKKVAKKAGVNTVPGYDAELKDAEECVKIAESIGYPVMIKASAGGGGKGMRIAHNADEVRGGYALSKNEAKSSFGDDRMLVEKFVVKPRHIEIQILRDAHGNGVYLNERECSIQRRNQKVIEEAPSPFLDPELRKAMGQQALDLAAAINYTTAGTVEFLVDNQKNFYFLEMNTRLQVEHPITECITGVDLVQEMIRVAHGHPLKFRQSDIPVDGWALEMRVYAEDPTRNFGTPSTGRLFRYEEPVGEGVRCDSGVREGSEISVFYDPMICKLVTYGKNRQEAIERGKTALDSYVIQGVTHNIPLLRDILTEDTFVKGDTDTSYLQKVYPEGFSLPPLSDTHVRTMEAVAAILEVQRSIRMKESTKSWDYVVSHGKRSMMVNVVKVQDGFEVNIDGKKTFFPALDMSGALVDINIDGEDYIFQIHGRGTTPTWKIGFQGASYEFQLMSSYVHSLLDIMPASKSGESMKELLSPMPGVVKAIAVKVGDKVFAGQEVCTIEAMKMQNKLAIGADGVVGEVKVKEGDTVSEDDLLIALK